LIGLQLDTGFLFLVVGGIVGGFTLDQKAYKNYYMLPIYNIELV
jgi:hypothetical protein